jgi:hypothetical protein
VADRQFRRTERIVVEWPVRSRADGVGARLLNRDGQPLPIPVAVAGSSDGRPMTVVSLRLAPLTAGDYAIELVARAGARTERQLLAFRVVP